MDIPAANLEPDSALPWDYAEWRRLQGAMLRLQSTARSTPRVLIVDDDPATRLLYALNLELEGLLVLEAADGRSGLARALEELPDLVLTDVTMPGLDGFQLAEALREDPRTREIPFIFLSGETTDGHEARAHELGALAYLTKPVDVRALAALVADVFADSDRLTQLPALPGDGAMPVSDSPA
jgi:CheY-like chemotaxis protein